MDTRTIIITTYSKNKEISKPDFVKEWTDHANEFHGISWNAKWVEEINKFTLKVADECGKEFDLIYNNQKAMK